AAERGEVPGACLCRARYAQCGRPVIRAAHEARRGAHAVNANLRHLRALLAVADTGSVTAAAFQCGVTQPAVTQSIGKLEREAGPALFRRTPHAIVPTAAGTILAERVRRAFAILDPALTAISPRLCLTISAAQLQAVIALVEARNF